MKKPDYIISFYKPKFFKSPAIKFLAKVKNTKLKEKLLSSTARLYVGSSLEEFKNHKWAGYGLYQVDVFDKDTCENLLLHYFIFFNTYTIVGVSSEKGFKHNCKEFGKSLRRSNKSCRKFCRRGWDTCRRVDFVEYIDKCLEDDVFRKFWEEDFPNWDNLVN